MSPAPITPADRDLVAKLAALTKDDGISAALQVIADHRAAEEAGKRIGPEALAPFLAVAANIAARPDDYGKARLLASGGLANPADLYPAHFLDLAAAFRLAPMSHRCETCGTKDGHEPGCAENVPPEPTPLEALKRLVFDLDALAASSEGVTGLHQNGDVATWSDIGEEGAFSSWLGEAMADARAVIDSANGEATGQDDLDQAAPCVALVGRIAGWSDDEADTANGRQVRKIAQRAAEGVVDVFPHTYTESQRERAKWALVGAYPEDGLADAVDMVAEALGMRKAGA